MLDDFLLEAWLEELQSKFGTQGLSRIQDMLQIRAGQLNPAAA